jgi:Flp pilus assembly protein TadG
MILRRSSATSTRRRGLVAVLVVLCLAVLVGVAAIALDGGMALTERRRAQDVADAAALAAAADLFANFQTNHGHDVNGTAAASALSIAAANGYSNDGTHSIVTVRVSPAQPVQPDPTITDGSGGLKPGYAEVTVQYNEPRFFSAIWGQGALPIQARACARGTWSVVVDGILLLDPSNSGSLTAKGNGSLTVNGAPVVVNSNDTNGAVATGGATVTAPAFNFAGTPGYGTSGSAQFDGTIQSGMTPTPDPLAYLNPPDPSSLSLQSSQTLQISGSQPVTINPGLYKGGIQISGQGTVTLQPGIYYMQGGGFSFTGQGTVVGNGVMIYNAPLTGTDSIDLHGQGSLTISPMTTGLYRGISFFQDRNATAPLSITGNGSVNMSGTFYAASASVNITGNSSNDVIGSQYISYDLSLKGNGSININWNGSTARTRRIGLIE